MAAGTTVPPPDTWESFSDKALLPDAVYYGKRLISLKRLWEVASRRATIFDSGRAYKALFDTYAKVGAVGTGEDGSFTEFDAGWAHGMYLALSLVRSAFNLPIPVPPSPLSVPDSSVHPMKELI